MWSPPLVYLSVSFVNNTTEEDKNVFSEKNILDKSDMIQGSIGLDAVIFLSLYAC